MKEVWINRFLGSLFALLLVSWPMVIFLINDALFDGQDGQFAGVIWGAAPVGCLIFLFWLHHFFTKK